MRKIYMQNNGLLNRLMLLLALLLSTVSAQADEIPVLTLDTEYTVAAFQSPTYQFTAPESGIVYMNCSSQEYPLLFNDSRCSEPCKVDINPYNNPRWSYGVVAGHTYYVGYGLNFAMEQTTFSLTMSGPTSIEVLDTDPQVNSIFACGYPISIAFNMPAQIGSASLQGGTSEPIEIPA